MDLEKEIEQRFKLQQEFLGTDKPVNKTEPFVTVRTITYQHANYIEECIKGVLMQKTNFPFEFIIGEDGSTDGAREICEKYAINYPNIIRLFNRDRKLTQLYDEQGSLVKRLNGHFTIKSSRAKYMAICEGDDYWTDPYKLQKQYDFLNNNPNYGLVATDFSIYNQRSGQFDISVFKNRPKKYPVYTNIVEFLISAGYMAPCTWMFLSELKSSELNAPGSDGSFAFYLHVLANSKIQVLNDTTAVYRILPESSSHIKSADRRYERELGILHTQMFYIGNLKLADYTRELVLSKHYKKVLPSLIFLDNQEELQKAKTYIATQDKGLREILLFFVAKFRVGIAFIRFLYRCKDGRSYRK